MDLHNPWLLQNSNIVTFLYFTFFIYLLTHLSIQEIFARQWGTNINKTLSLPLRILQSRRGVDIVM